MKQKILASDVDARIQFIGGGMDGTRTRDLLRDRQAF